MFMKKKKNPLENKTINVETFRVTDYAAFSSSRQENINCFSVTSFSQVSQPDRTSFVLQCSMLTNTFSLQRFVFF